MSAFSDRGGPLPRNSVVEGGFESLEPGSRVRLEVAERESGEGWQAHHGPPDRQASLAGRTGLIPAARPAAREMTPPQRSRLAHRFPRLKDLGYSASAAVREGDQVGAAS